MTEHPNESAAGDGADPSMEEILASIRRILNDDEVPALPQPEPEPEFAAADDDEDVLILDETMLVGEPVVAESVAMATAMFDPPPVAPRPVRAEPVAPPPVVPPPVAPPPVEMVPAPGVRPAASEPMESDLLGAAAAAAAASSVGSLLRTLTAGRATQVYGGGPTLEDMVRGELRPLLKDWLDTHLPPMVERLVRAEIERVVGRFVP